MAKKVGSIVLATDQGLGYLAKAFYDNGLINKVLIKHHTSRQNHYDWYKDDDRINEQQLLECDIIFLFETAFNWELIKKAQAKGIKIILMPMYECTPDPLPVVPDLIICPSLLDLENYKQYNSIFLPVPVDLIFRIRKRARIFVHNAGNGGIGGRNGTKEIIAAMQYVKSPIRLILRSQVDLQLPQGAKEDIRINLLIGQYPADLLWRYGDVFLFPEKFNGLSLPLQEAFASGMAVMAGDRFPINTWLPKEILIPVWHYSTESITRKTFKCAQYEPAAIAACIDAWYNKDITKLSTLGKQWGKENSWKILKEKYKEVMFA